MTKIVNYGLGNVRAFMNVYEGLGIPVSMASTPDELLSAKKLILPGVGAFDNAMERLEESGLRETLHHVVQDERVPVLGVCVGMQMLARSSAEGTRPGLGWIDAEVKKFSTSVKGSARRVPHMGWNDVRLTRPSTLFDGLEDARFYFLHSYFLEAHKAADVLALTDYGGEFACGVSSGTVFGVQFHPEKSHQWGSRLLRNFAEF